MTHARGSVSFARALAVVAVAGALVAGSTPGSTAAKGKAAGPELTVMTRNLYLGADLFPIIAGATQSPEAAYEAGYAAWQIVQATNFTARVERLADEIAATKPDVVGLQEVTTYRTDPDADGPSTPATTVAIDFLPLLLTELTDRGASYTTAVAQTNTDFELPVDQDPDDGEQDLTEDVRYTDGDAILVRKGVSVLGTDAALFNARVSASTTIGTLSILRGWTSVELKVAGKRVRIVNTHLEVGGGNPIFPNVQMLQADELLAGPLRTNLPTVLLGDLNSPADGSGTTTYQKMVGGGFRDAWSSTHPGDPGFTCCHNETLTNPTSQHDERIDFVLTDAPWGHFSADILGEEPADRTPGGLWPSDHSGVVATVALATCGGKLATVVGGPDRDRLKGTGKADRVQAFDGNDTISAGGGKDLVCGGDGRDVLKTGAGNDRADGETGKDVLVGGSGVDTCTGGPGRDQTRGCERGNA
jgi:endonuclease/exonuclease/phosphatase family metal-dependent hydrolase